MTLVEGVRNLIKASGITSVYIIDSPDSGNTVVIVPYASDAFDGLTAGRQFMQIRVAADGFTESEALVWRAYKAVSDQRPEGTDREIVGAISAVQEPYFLEKDTAGRYIHIFNCSVAAQWPEE